MSYDGFYAGLSTRGSANEVLNQIVVVKEQVSALEEEAKLAATDSLSSAKLSKQYAADSQESAEQSKGSAEKSLASSVLAAQSAASAGRFITVGPTPPTVRANGTPLQVADEWQNTINTLRYSWSGQAWIALNSSAQQLEVELSQPSGGGIVGSINSVGGSKPRTVASKLDETFSSFDAGLASGASDTLRAAMLNATYLQPMLYGSYRRINGTGSTTGVSDEANFAGQGLASGRPIGWVKHHYTDGIMMQMDNVGDGTALVIKNARNPVRRADKPNDYVGGGIFLSLSEEDVEAGFSKGLFFISKAAEFVWTGVKGVASMLQNKVEDGLFAFQMRTTNAHRYFLRILNGGSQLLSIENDVTYTRLVIKSGLPQENGFVLTTEAGRLRLDCAGSYIEIAKPLRAPTGNLLLGVSSTDAAVEAQVPFKLRGYASLSNLPSASTFVGCMAMCAGRPVYANGGQWRYVGDDSPVV